MRDLARRFGSKRLLVVNLGLLALVAWSFSGEYMRDRDARSTVDSLQAQADEMRDGIDERTAELDVTPAEVENEARLKLNMRRPGEEVVVVKGSTLRVHSQVLSTASASRIGNAARWWKLFFE